MNDLLPHIQNISNEISYKQQEKADVELSICNLNSQLSILESKKEQINNKIEELTSRKYVFGRKQYRNPDVRQSLVKSGSESEDQMLMELAFIVEEKDLNGEELTNEMIDFLIVLDIGVRAKNSNMHCLVAQISKNEDPLSQEVNNDN